MNEGRRLIPVSVITGFLGSGKTTLISRILCEPSFNRLAVIVNEFGDVGLDHDLIAISDDSVLTLNTGCLCCSIQTDLARTMTELLQRRADGSIVFDRVVIETSGLSNPSSMLQSMITDETVSAAYQVPFVITLVDAVRGKQNLLGHAEARNQVAMADKLLLSKTDLQEPSAELLTLLDGLNPLAQQSVTSMIISTDLFGASSIDVLTERLGRTPRGQSHAGIETFSILRDRPMPALVVTMLLEALAEHCGARLLRIKGLVAVFEMPESPMLINGVGHVISRPDFLDRWPDEDHRTRIVCITTCLPRHFVSRCLDAIEEEVWETMTTM